MDPIYLYLKLAVDNYGKFNLAKFPVHALSHCRMIDREPMIANFICFLQIATITPAAYRQTRRELFSSAGTRTSVPWKLSKIDRRTFALALPSQVHLSVRVTVQRQPGIPAVLTRDHLPPHPICIPRHKPLGIEVDIVQPRKKRTRQCFRTTSQDAETSKQTLYPAPTGHIVV